MIVLEINNLYKKFGRITAVDHLNLSVENGMVFGLLGPNGSGKTTTLGMILGVTNPTSGSFSWFGDGHDHRVRQRIGSILEKPNFYPTISAYKNLQLACKIKEVDEYRIDEVLDQVGLLDRKNDSFRTYSLGMKQRLAIGSALLAHPEVLILDEPTNGLDPKGIAEIRQLIYDIASSGKTIILASHLLDEVQKVCSHFAILDKGKLIHTGRVDADLGETVIIEVGADDMAELEIAIMKFDNYLSHTNQKNTYKVSCNKETNCSDLLRYLVSKEIYPYHLVEVKKKLEQQFMEIISNSGQRA